jgi:hypothetical protein
MRNRKMERVAAATGSRLTGPPRRGSARASASMCLTITHLFGRRLGGVEAQTLVRIVGGEWVPPFARGVSRVGRNSEAGEWLFRCRRHGGGMVVNNEPTIAILDVDEAVARR